MPKYEKIPVVIEARVWSGDLSSRDTDDLANWMGDWLVRFEKTEMNTLIGDPMTGYDLVIRTKESNEFFCAPGTFIIQGVDGEYYGCAPEIMAQTYRQVDDAVLTAYESKSRPAHDAPTCHLRELEDTGRSDAVFP